MSNPNPVTKWKPGQLINPKGRPKKGFSFTEGFKKILSERDPVKKIKKYKVIINKAFELASRGDVEMIKYIINRLEGMPAGSEPTLNIDNRSVTYIGSQEQNEEIDKFVVSRYKELEREGKVG